MISRKCPFGVFPLLFGILTAAAPRPAAADGCYVSPEEQDLVEPTQIGLIVHDGAREDLYLQVDFTEESGAAVERMGWILALPAVPEVSEADRELFVELMEMTRPYEDDDAFGSGCSGSAAMGGAGDFRDIDAVEVESRQVVGAFDVTTVTSDSTAPLAAWIAERGFAMKAGTEEILQFYVDKAWHFVAVDVDLEQAAADGFLPPLRFSFETTEALFPLRISAINGLGHDEDPDYDGGLYTGILLYAVAAGALGVQGESAEPEFVHPLDVADLSSYPAVAAALPDDGVIVKLRLDKAPAEMTDDLILVPRSDEAAVLPARRGGFDVAWIAVGLLALAGAPLPLRRRVRSRG